MSSQTQQAPKTNNPSPPKAPNPSTQTPKVLQSLKAPKPSLPPQKKTLNRGPACVDLPLWARARLRANASHTMAQLAPLLAAARLDLARLGKVGV